jgi:hypothetical protein
MVSPKRAWPPREKDAESAESAAFEATVAVVKETVVRSGEVLVSAKEDLSDHKRWLEIQRAAGQADRLRHERWLERQREEQEALARREEAKRRRKLMRQRAARAVENAIFTAVDIVLSAFWLAVAKVAAFFSFIGSSIAGGFFWVIGRLNALDAYVARLIRSGASFLAAKARALLGSTGAALSAAGSSVAAKSGALARSATSTVTAAGSSLAAKSGELVRTAGSTVSAASASLVAKSSVLARSGASVTSGASGSVATVEEGFPAELATEEERVVAEPARVVTEALGAPNLRAVFGLEAPLEAKPTQSAESLVKISAEFAAARATETIAPAETAPAETVRTALVQLEAGPVETTAAAAAVSEQETPADRARSTAAGFTARFALASAGIVRLARPGVEAIVAGFAALSTKAGPLATGLGEKMTAGAASVSAKAGPLARSVGDKMSAGLAAVSAKAAPLAKSIGTKALAGLVAASSKRHTLAPSLQRAAARTGQVASAYASGASVRAGDFARETARRANGMLARFEPKPASRFQTGSENELSSPTDALSSPAEGMPSPAGSVAARIGSFDLSQMLIISGVVLLVFGAILVGSGLVLRARPARDVVEAAPVADKALSPHAVVWFYEEPELPIVERSVFSAELTPKGVRLTGLAIKAENNSDEALTDLQGVVKPDAKRLDLKLEVKLDTAPAGGNGAQGVEVAVTPDGAIPPHAFFKLVFPFPPEAHGEEPGIALDDFIGSYGGLLLKLRYHVDGTRKSLIQYLTPEMLKAQLVEIQREADGS